MEDKSKSRVTMLALSGVLFGVSAFGWMIQRGSVPTTDSATNTVQEQPQAASASASATAPNAVIQPATVYPSTRLEDAAKEARAELKRDPFDSIAIDTPVRIAYAPQRRHSAYHGANYVPPPPEARLLDPPAVNDPSLYAGGSAYLPAPAEVAPPRPNKLTVRDVHLVGLMDGKAIFRVNHDAAKQLSLPHAFTLGKGESFANIRVDNVSTEAATVHDGNHVSTKALENVH